VNFALIEGDVVIRDENGNAVGVILDDAVYRLQVEATGTLATRPPVPPPGTTEVVLSADNPLELSGSNSPHDTEHVIGSGDTFHLQILVAGAGGDPSEKGSRVDLIYDDGTEHVVERLFLLGASVSIVFPDSTKARDGTVMAGTGTEKLILRRYRLSNAGQEVDSVVRGYEV